MALLNISIFKIQIFSALHNTACIISYFRFTILYSLLHARPSDYIHTRTSLINRNGTISFHYKFGSAEHEVAENLVRGQMLGLWPIFTPFGCNRALAHTIMPDRG